MTSPPALHGRESEMSLLREYLDLTIAGRQQLVLLEGDPGIGKSFLLREFARTHTRRGLRRPRIFYLHAPEGEAYRPVRHAALAATNRGLYAKRGEQRQAIEIARSTYTDWLAAIPVWGSLIAAITATLRVLRRLVEPKVQGGTGEAMDEDTAALLRAARRRPLILLLDDLERADREAVARLENLICVADEGARILIIGAYRPTAPGVPDPPVHSLRRSLPRQSEPHVYRRLAPLSASAVEIWLQERFPGAAIPPPFLRWLHGATGGHPATIAATLAHLQRKGAIRWERERLHFATDLDDLDLPAIGHSFSDLSAINPHIAQVVEAAALLGEEFDSVSLAWLVERDELAVEDQLALGAHFGLLHVLGERTSDDGEVATVYRFASPHLRAALSRKLPAERRAALQKRMRHPGAGGMGASPHAASGS